MNCDVTSARICLLGKPALFIGDRLQPFGGPRRAIALLAYVLLHREHALSRAVLAEQFWPDEEDEDARASLRRHLHRALAALPAAPAARPWVIADKVTLRWNPEAPLELDTNSYERLSSAKQREAAVALYRGDYLEDFYDEWVLPERERLRELQSTNLVALVEERRRALDYPAAIAFAQSLSRLDPVREDTLRRLMSLRFAAGDRSGALADFEIFSRRLRDELSADPMPETIALREAIRSNDLSTLENERVAGTAPSIARPGFPFAGRGAALQALRDAWEGAARGSAVTAIVSGEAGIGKSRLIGELVALAEAQGGRVMFGTTAAIETEPYQPIAEALRGALPLLRFDRLDAVRLAALSSLVPEVREFARHVQRLPQLEPDRDRERLFDAVENAFEHLAEKRPLLLVLEDLHWAGAATIELLEFLLRRLRERSVLVVASFREEEVDAGGTLGEFVRRLDSKRSRHIALGPLTEDDLRALVAASSSQADEALARELLAASDGNALFATELLRDRMSGSAAGTMPARIADTVIARVNRLSSPARSLIETAAVAGSGFDAEVVRRACGWSFADVFDALDELLDRALVRVSAQRRGDFAFSHQLVHAAIYETIAEETRRGLHRRVARTLEQLYPERPSLAGAVARHYDNAGLPDEAVARYLPATRYALALFAHHEALALASRALQLCTNAHERFELHRLREEAAKRIGDGAARRLDCRAMTEIAQSLADEELLGTALCHTIALHLHLNEHEEGEHSIALLAALGERSPSARWIVEAALAKARLQNLRGYLRDAEATLRDVEPHLAALPDADLAFEYWYVRSIATQTDLISARAFLGKAQERTGDDRTRTARALRARAMAAFKEADTRSFGRFAGDLLALYREIGDLGGQAQAHMYLAAAAWYALDMRASRSHSSDALALFERLEKRDSMALVILNRGVFAGTIGDFASAETDYREARAICESIGSFPNAGTAMANLAMDMLECGNVEGARALANEALAFTREHDLEDIEILSLEAVAAVECELGMFESARDRLKVALPWRRVNEPARVLKVLTQIIPVSIGLGEYDTALAAADELVRGVIDNPTSLTHPARGLFVAATAYAAAGHDERAAALRSEARELLRERSARIEDEASRTGYLQHPAHRGILTPLPVDGTETMAAYALTREPPA
jgi:DNA-binding SARP family transcriptional activator